MGNVIPIGPFKRVNVAKMVARFIVLRRHPDKATEFRSRPYIKEPTRLVRAAAFLWPDKELRVSIRRPRSERLRLFPLVKLVGALKRQPTILIDWVRPTAARLQRTTEL